MSVGRFQHTRLDSLREQLHAGRLHRHMRAAGLGQPGRQCEQSRRRGRKLPMLGRGLPTLRDAHAGAHAPRVDIQPGAPGLQVFHPSPPDRKGAGMESAGTKSTRRARRASRYRNTGCSRDSGPSLLTGSLAPKKNRPPCQRHALHSTHVSSMRGSGSAGWTTRTASHQRRQGSRTSSRSGTAWGTP